MSTAAQPLSAARVRERLVAPAWITRLDVIDTVDSTNEELRRRAATGAPAGSVLLAEEQTAGRGRRGHDWFSARGTGLYLSALFRPRLPVRMLTRWTLAGAVAAAEACRRSSGAKVTIDWPNDLMAEGRKLGGVLVDMRSAGDRASELIVGIGINVAHRSLDQFPPSLGASATSLAMVAGGNAPDRETVAAACLSSLGEIAEMLEADDWPAILCRWEALAPAAHGARVVVTQAGRMRGAGVTAGVAEDGALRVALAEGGIELVRLRDSVRPLEA